MLTPEAREKARAARKTAPTRRQKMQAFTATFAEQRRRFPKMALPIIDQEEQGSLPAAIKLMCLDCSNFVRQEVRDCVISWCPLYPHRPYQRIKGRNPNDPPAPAGGK
jgi:hypothetical protein